MRRNRITTGLVSLLLLTINGLSVTSARQQAQQPPDKKPVQLTLGSVEVVTPKISGDLVREARLAGPNTRVTVQDRASRSTLVFYANEITLRKEKTDFSDFIEMKGNLRYTVTQTVERGGKRVLEGTAGTGLYRRATQRIELTNGVNATLTDEAGLKKPAALRADRVTVNIGTTPYTYTITGNPQATRVQFEPLPPAPNPQAAEPPASLSFVEITQFREGVLQVGQKAAFNGPKVTVNLKTDSDGTEAKFEGEEIEADFMADGKAVKRVVANSKATFNVKRPARDNKSEDTATGSCGRAIFDAEEGLVTLKESVDVRIVAPASLDAPATASADTVMFRTRRPYHYVVSGKPERTKIKFTPKAPPAPPQTGENQPPPRFAFGNVEIERFDKGTFEPGKAVQFTGEKMQFRTNDAETKTKTLLQCPRVVATFKEEEIIGTAEATGGVTYHIERLDPMTKTPQAIRGTADHATFNNTTATRELKLFGPINAEVIDEVHFVEPATVAGKGDAIWTLYLKGDLEFDIESPMETTVIKFTPREGTSPPETKTSPPPAGKKSTEKK